MDGALDDVGIYNNALGAKDVAVTHGLGLFEGQNLADADIAGMIAAFDSTSDYATDQNQWYYVSGLAGTTGDTGGSVGGGDAYIVLDASGNGMSLVPEPATVALLGLGSLVLLRRRR
jgi:hypothetical protein